MRIDWFDMFCKVASMVLACAAYALLGFRAGLGASLMIGSWALWNAAKEADRDLAIRRATPSPVPPTKND